MSARYSLASPDDPRWLTRTHRCWRPSSHEVELTGVGIGSRWQCPECAAVHRVIDFEASADGVTVVWQREP